MAISNRPDTPQDYAVVVRLGVRDLEFESKSRSRRVAGVSFELVGERMIRIVENTSHRGNTGMLDELLDSDYTVFFECGLFARSDDPECSPLVTLHFVFDGR